MDNQNQFINKIIAMYKNIQSFPSIEASIQELQIKQQEKERYSKQQYLLNLKAQCEIRENALKTAESLIAAYQKQNQLLKQQNSYLKEKITDIEQKVTHMEDQSEELRSMQKTLFKYSQKINELLENNMANQQKIHALEKELEVARQQKQSEFESMKAKIKQKSRQQKQRRELQSHFKNSYQFDHLDESYSSSKGRRPQKQHFGSEKKVLQWKLKQKDQQVLILLKRLKQKQQKLDRLAGRRHPTYDSMDIASTKQSKKMNASQLQH